jgi:hypothetical protein
MFCFRSAYSGQYVQMEMSRGGTASKPQKCSFGISMRATARQLSLGDVLLEAPHFLVSGLLAVRKLTRPFRPVLDKRRYRTSGITCELPLPGTLARVQTPGIVLAAAASGRGRECACTLSEACSRLLVAMLGRPPCSAMVNSRSRTYLRARQHAGRALSGADAHLDCLNSKTASR